MASQPDITAADLTLGEKARKRQALRRKTH